MELKAAEVAKKVAVWVVAVAIPAIGGFFVHDVVDFRNKQYDAENAIVESVRQANDDVAKLMLKFDSLALKGEPVSSADREAFDQTIVKAYDASARLKHFIPAINPAVDSYEQSLIQLKAGAEKLKSQDTGRAYVEAASKYLAEQSELEKEVAKNRRSYFKMLVFNDV